MRRPPTLPDLCGSPLLTRDGVDLRITDCGTHADCWDCQFFDIGPDAEGGEHCAMEAAGIIGNATPELARLFGWTHEGGDTYWDPPQHCPWFADKSDPDIPFDDPAQLDAFARTGER